MNFFSNLSASKIFALLSGLALLILAVKYNPAQADIPSTSNATGKIMMHSTAFVMSNNNTMFQVLVWNTETGKSKLYYLNVKGAEMKPTSYQLPASPLY
jgi:hypothetical protein